jgi:hypothetical protein
VLANAETINTLLEYAHLMNDEGSETLISLCYLARREYLLGTEFYAVLQKELQAQLDNLTENAYIEERDETVTRTIRTLEWL